VRVHLDNSFLVRALSGPGFERERLSQFADSDHVLQMSAVAWYEFARGPRTPEQLGVARALLHDDGIVPFSEDFAELAAEVFRQLGSPRRRATDIAIAVTAMALGARLVTGNAADFKGIAGLDLVAD
jgi:predicted nucleic acid-binding protein